MSAGGAAHLPLLATGRSPWACASAAVGDAYVRVVRAKAVRSPRVTAGGDGGGRCATRRAPPLPSPSPPFPLPLLRGGRRGPAFTRLTARESSRDPSPRPRPASPPVSVCTGAAGPRQLRVPGGRRRPYSCPRAHFADGETDARNPRMPRARGSCGFEPKSVRIGSLSFPQRTGSCSALKDAVACQARVFCVPSACTPPAVGILVIIRSGIRFRGKAVIRPRLLSEEEVGLHSARYSNRLEQFTKCTGLGREEQQVVLEVPSWARNQEHRAGFEDLPWQVLSSRTCFVYF